MLETALLFFEELANNVLQSTTGNPLDENRELRRYHARAIWFWQLHVAHFGGLIWPPLSH